MLPSFLFNFLYLNIFRDFDTYRYKVDLLWFCPLVYTNKVAMMSEDELSFAACALKADWKCCHMLCAVLSTEMSSYPMIIN